MDLSVLSCPMILAHPPRQPFSLSSPHSSFTLGALMAKSEAHLPSSQPLPHSFLKTPGVVLVPLVKEFLQRSLATSVLVSFPLVTPTSDPGRLVRHLPLASPPLPPKPFIFRTSRPTPRFARFWPKSSVRNSFRMRSSTNCVCNFFRMRTCKKTGGGGNLVPVRNARSRWDGAGTSPRPRR
jgi:hypothetical protein